MTATVTDIRIEEGAKAVFFNVLIELDDEIAFGVPGWKVVDGRIYPPSKGRGNSYYSVILASPKFARVIQTALEKANPEGLELEPDAYVSTKWGQSSLRSIYRDKDAAMEIWKKYKGHKNGEKVEAEG